MHPHSCMLPTQQHSTTIQIKSKPHTIKHSPHKVFKGKRVRGSTRRYCFTEFFRSNACSDSPNILSFCADVKMPVFLTERWRPAACLPTSAFVCLSIWPTTLSVPKPPPHCIRIVVCIVDLLLWTWSLVAWLYTSTAALRCMYTTLCTAYIWFVDKFIWDTCTFLGYVLPSRETTNISTRRYDLHI